MDLMGFADLVQAARGSSRRYSRNRCSERIGSQGGIRRTPSVSAPAWGNRASGQAMERPWRDCVIAVRRYRIGRLYGAQIREEVYRDRAQGVVLAASAKVPGAGVERTDRQIVIDRRLT